MAEHLHVDVSGDPNAPALALVHGFLSSNLQWEPNRAVLQERFRLFEVELWGHGASPSPTDDDAHTIDRYLEELERIRRDHHVERWLVGGQSFSAGIAIRYGLNHPSCTLGVVFTNSRSGLAAPGEIPPRGRLTEEEHADFSARDLPMHPRHAKRIPDDLRRRMEDAADAVDTETLLRCLQLTNQLSCRDVVPELQVPCLLVNGRFERIFQPYRAFAEAEMKNLQIVDLDGGHAVNIDAPEGFNDAVIRFAASCVG